MIDRKYESHVVLALSADEAFRSALGASRMTNKVVVAVTPIMYDRPTEWTVVVSGDVVDVAHVGSRRPWERT